MAVDLERNCEKAAKFTLLNWQRMVQMIILLADGISEQMEVDLSWCDCFSDPAP